MTIIYSVMTRDLVYMGRYDLGFSDEVIKLGRISLNTLFYSKNKIGFARFIDGKQ